MLRAYLEAATGLYGQPLDHRQAETSALAHAFGGIERFDAAAQLIFVHATATVANLQPHQRPFSKARRPWGTVGLKACADTQGATVAHGVAGVDRKVEQRQLQLMGVYNDCGQGWVNLYLHGNCRPQ
ncbi:hypothetical protein D3C79_726400 [compost metagenome]